jgi:hypothetical protein
MPAANTRVTIQCQRCGSDFDVIASRAGKARFCSMKCKGAVQADQYSISRLSKECGVCGSTFSFPEAHKSRRVFCSVECATKGKKYDPPKGSSHYAWKGFSIHADGYKYVRIPGHPFSSNGYVFEHRIVMEDWMRESDPDHHFLVDVGGVKYLSPDIVVHHINEVVADNRGGNLVACTPQAHSSIHAGLKAPSGHVWPSVDDEGWLPYKVSCTCLRCGSTFMKKRSDVSSTSGKYCNRYCYLNRNKPFIEP